MCLNALADFLTRNHNVPAFAGSDDIVLQLAPIEIRENQLAPTSTLIRRYLRNSVLGHLGSLEFSAERSVGGRDNTVGHGLAIVRPPERARQRHAFRQASAPRGEYVLSKNTRTPRRQHLLGRTSETLSLVRPRRHGGPESTRADKAGSFHRLLVRPATLPPDISSRSLLRHRVRRHRADIYTTFFLLAEAVSNSVLSISGKVASTPAWRDALRLLIPGDARRFL